MIEESKGQSGSSSAEGEVVLITGITGYVGSHLGLQLLDQCGSRFKLRATVRNPKKLEGLKKAYGEEKFSKIEFVEADLLQKEALDKAIQGAQYIIHVANPLPGATQLSEEQMMQPTVEGMKTILDAALKYSVKKLIVTSSLATIVGGVWKRDTGENHYTEADVAPAEGADGYGRSKIA